MDPSEPAAQNPKQQIIERLKSANNVLVTVSASPSVDQLAACLGFTLLLNKMGKHATAVFSGEVPSTIEFLKPEETLEKTTDSLRDFIIALDKSKADKLRYKIEDQFVKIFITPYRTSLSEKDLDFSQGDFNVDVIVAIGVKEQADLDKAITAHGRILHDATVISVNNQDESKLGTINWVDASVSSLSEMMAAISSELDKDGLDAQMATAFLTGIVAETDRFSNAKTAPSTMTLAATLMAAGANQQLVASKLEEEEDKPPEPPPKPPVEPPKPPKPKPTPPEPKPKVEEPPPPEPEPEKAEAEDTKGALQVGHDDATEHEEEIGPNEIRIDTKGTVHKADELIAEEEAAKTASALDNNNPSSLVLEPPTLGGRLTANTEPEGLEPSSDPLSSHANGPILEHNRDNSTATPPVSTTPADKPVTDDFSVAGSQTLADLEETVDTAHPSDSSKGVDQARNAVEDAINTAPDGQPLEPLESLGARPMDLNLPSAPLPPQDAAASTFVNPSGPPPSGTPAPPPPLPPAPPVPPPLTPPHYLTPPPANNDQNKPQQPLAPF